MIWVYIGDKTLSSLTATQVVMMHMNYIGGDIGNYTRILVELMKGIQRV